MSTVATPPLTRPRRRLVVEPRVTSSLAVRAAILAGSLAGAAAFGAVLLLVTGYDPAAAYEELYAASFGSPLAFSQTLVQTTPIVLTALGAAIAYRLGLYTIGGDGQLLVERSSRPASRSSSASSRGRS